MEFSAPADIFRRSLGPLPMRPLDQVSIHYLFEVSPVSFGTPFSASKPCLVALASLRSLRRPTHCLNALKCAGFRVRSASIDSSPLSSFAASLTGDPRHLPSPFFIRLPCSAHLSIRTFLVGLSRLNAIKTEGSTKMADTVTAWLMGSWMTSDP